MNEITTRIVVVDDHPLLLSGLCLLLNAESDMEVVGQAEGEPLDQVYLLQFVEGLEMRRWAG